MAYFSSATEDLCEGFSVTVTVQDAATLEPFKYIQKLRTFAVKPTDFKVHVQYHITDALGNNCPALTEADNAVATALYIDGQQMVSYGIDVSDGKEIIFRKQLVGDQYHKLSFSLLRQDDESEQVGGCDNVII